MNLLNMFRRQPKLPPQASFAEEVREEYQYTPDIVELEKWEHQLLFVCDETSEGMYGHKWIEGSLPIYEAYTQSSHMMVTEDLGRMSRPLIFTSTLGYQNPKPFKPIRGKIYKVPSPATVFKNIDKEKLNGVQFQRVFVWVVVPYQKLFSKDRQVLENVLMQLRKPEPLKELDDPDARTKRKMRKERGHVSLVGSGLFKESGVWRFQAWMYVAVDEYWSELLNFSLHTPVQTYKNDDPNCIVKEFYDFKRDQEPPF